MKNMTLAHMAEACGGILYGREEDWNREICSITTDSRKAEPGCLFAAIPGERVDGHDFIGQVFEKGALCVITEREPANLPEARKECEAGTFDGNGGTYSRNYIKVESSIRALGALAAYYLEQLAIPVVGVTGSVGKTSTKEMIAAVLSQKYRTLKTDGNFNNELGLPLTIFRLREEDEIAVLEMGINHFGEMHRLAAIAKPDTCVITNIGQCHLEYLGDRDGVLRAKTEIFDYLRSDGHIILNGDDDKLMTVREVKGIRPTFFGLGKDNTVYADQIVKKGLDGIACRICIKKSKNLSEDIELDGNAGKEGSSGTDAEVTGESDNCFNVQIPIPGEHMVRNALAAAAVGLQYGLTTEEIRAGIESLQPVSGRFHIIHTENFTIIDDCYNANPMSMKASLGVLQDGGTNSEGICSANDDGDSKEYGDANARGSGGANGASPAQGSRKVAVLGDMGELGEDEVRMHRSVGEYAAGLDIDLVVCVGSLSAHIAEGINDVSQAKTVDMVHEAGMAGSSGRIHTAGTAGSGIETVVLPDLSALLAQLPALVRKGDTILVKASHFMHFEKVVAQLETMETGA
ncbi:MAG: UDP-N-acetylmuramoyl-tripeptide--D-alanyl-D-alanine ligase [Clostridiales bacterium]|nr:UDP-N-acetylmuramoyl-tripeptide--D-alanyl-D-alanine ligase [Clostridiales bacterium]